MRFSPILPAVVLLAMLGLAGCGAPAPAPNTPQGECQRVVDQDPEVRAAAQRDLVDRASGAIYSSSTADALKRQKMVECLRLRGVSVPGGVEKLER